MGLLEKGVVEALPFRVGDIIVLMRKPAVPFGWDHVPVRASHREIVVILDPPPLGLICLCLKVQRGVKSS